MAGCVEAADVIKAADGLGKTFTPVTLVDVMGSKRDVVVCILESLYIRYRGYNYMKILTLYNKFNWDHIPWGSWSYGMLQGNIV